MHIGVRQWANLSVWPEELNGEHYRRNKVRSNTHSEHISLSAPLQPYIIDQFRREKCAPIFVEKTPLDPSENGYCIMHACMYILYSCIGWEPLPDECVWKLVKLRRWMISPATGKGRVFEKGSCWPVVLVGQDPSQSSAHGTNCAPHQLSIWKNKLKYYTQKGRGAMAKSLPNDMSYTHIWNGCAKHFFFNHIMRVFRQI